MNVFKGWTAPKITISESNYFQEDYMTREEINKLLYSKYPKDHLDGMKALVAQMSRGKDVSLFFPDVVKLVISDVMEVKKLVYLFVTANSDAHPELSRLAIASFQKDLRSMNSLTRAHALKALSSCRVPDFSLTVIEELRKAVKDLSKHVRKTAASSLVKVVEINPEISDKVLDLLKVLLDDTSPMVLSSALYAYQQICPDKFELIHPNFRKICRLLADFSEWGQIIALDVLARYSKLFFLPLESVEEESEQGDAEEEDKKEDDPDLLFLLQETSKLFFSGNSGVLLAALELHRTLNPESVSNAHILQTGVGSKSPSMRYLVLSSISTIVSKSPNLFRPMYKSFYLTPSDTPPTRLLKLDILAQLCSETNAFNIFQELQAYLKDSDKEFVVEVIQTICRCACSQKDLVTDAMSILMHLISSKRPNIVATAVIVIRRLLKEDASQHRKIVSSLCKIVDKIEVPTARASIVWIVGEYHETIPLIAPDVLRKLLKNVLEEDVVVKLQILNLAVKLFLANPQQCGLMFKYVLNLCKYDTNIDLRDRARFYRSIFLQKKKKDPRIEKVDPEIYRAFQTEVQKMFLAEKPTPVLTSPFVDKTRFHVCSLSHAASIRIEGYQPLPNFRPAEEIPDSSIRDPPSEKPEEVVVEKKKPAFEWSDSENEEEESDGEISENEESSGVDSSSDPDESD